MCSVSQVHHQRYFILGDGCQRKRAKRACRRYLLHITSRGFVASDIFHGTRIARRYHLLGTIFRSGVVMRAIHGILHLNPSNEKSISCQEFLSRLVVRFRMMPCIAAIHRVNKLLDDLTYDTDLQVFAVSRVINSHVCRFVLATNRSLVVLTSERHDSPKVAGP